MPLAPGSSLVMVLVAALLTLAAGAHLELTLVTRAAYQQGFAIAHAPARSPGHSRPGAKPGWS